MMSSAYEEVATGLKQIIDAEFAVEGVVAAYDNLHESLGQQRMVCGIAPVDDNVRENNAVVQETFVEVKFYDFWKKEINPLTEIDPRRITAFAERFRRALRVYNKGRAGTGQMWYFDLRRVQYPKDPTGNNSRFVATIRAFGNNAGLIETS